MKKLLLLIFAALGLSASAQNTFWQEYSTGFLNAGTTQGFISYTDSGAGQVAWAYGRDGSIGGTANYQIWSRTTDGGLTWTNGPINVGNTTLGIGSIHAVDATTAFIAVFPNNTTSLGGIWKTIDSGATWTKQPTAVFNVLGTSFTNLVHFWDANVGMCQGDPTGGYFEIYTTVDGGANWVRVPSANIPTPLLDEVGYTGQFETDSSGGDTIWFNTSLGRIYKSTDRGLHWTVSQAPITDFGGDLRASYSMKNANDGIMISSEWGTWTTADGAATWQEAVFGGEYYRNFDVAYIPGTDNMYVSTGQDVDTAENRGSSYSLDGGLNWVDINNLDTDPVTGGGVLEFFDYAHGLASSFTNSSTDGGIFKWLAPNLAIADFDNQSPFTLSPNPTSGMVSVLGKNIKNVTVYDILGKVVSNNNFSALNEVSVNLGSLNAGVYLLKVTNDAGASSTIKVVKQ